VYFPLNTAFSFEILQVSNRLSGGKPFLLAGELLPMAITEVPSHLRGYLEGILTALFQDGQNFIRPDKVVID
jgi:hypothetical protein